MSYLLSYRNDRPAALTRLLKRPGCGKAVVAGRWCPLAGGPTAWTRLVRPRGSGGFQVVAALRNAKA